MKHFLIVVDIQNDFVDGALGTKEAEGIIASACEKIKNFEGEIFVTYDTHFKDYLTTAEGKKLPVEHCIKDTDGWQLNGEILKALNSKKYTAVEKLTFGSTELPSLIKQAAGNDDFDITVIGLCTDICVVSNALILKANFYDKKIIVDKNCCAGVTVDSHNAALTTMQMCQIEVV